MKAVLHLSIGVWVVIGLNIIMAFGAIGVFLRMAPAIEVILEKNDASLGACENMLAQIAGITSEAAKNEALLIEFERSLALARGNVTEEEEPEAIRAIDAVYKEAFGNVQQAKRESIVAVQKLAQINRNAMDHADKRARSLGNAGAWWVVFMASCTFGAALYIMRRHQKNLIEVLEEINAVLNAHRLGDHMRRCSGAGLPSEIRHIYKGINDLLDKR